MDRTQHDDKVISTLRKLEWLQNTIRKCIAMDRSQNHDIQNDVALLDRLVEKLQFGRQITKSDMGICNRILKSVKSHYRIDIDWRGDIKSHHRTEHVLNKKRNVDADLYAQDTWKSNKMNLLYSWIEW